MIDARTVLLITIILFEVFSDNNVLHRSALSLRSRVLLQDSINADLCLWGGRQDGGLYEYQGEWNGRAYYKQKECIRHYDGGDLKVAGDIYLYSVVSDVNRYHLSKELGAISTTYCVTADINSPLECQEWNSDRNIYGIFSGECPNIFGNEDYKFKGIEVEILNEILSVGDANIGDELNGTYDIQLGLNMFTKSTSSTPIYLYFDPYYFQWRFITSYNKGDDIWIGPNPQRETCPVYSTPTLTSEPTIFEQFIDGKLSFNVPLQNQINRQIEGSMTLTALRATSFIVNDDINQYIKVKENIEWISKSSSLIECNLNDLQKYIKIDIDVYNEMNIVDNGILLMESGVLNDINLNENCKYPVLKVLNDPLPEWDWTNNIIKIYVSTDVSMFDYIDEIDVDLQEIDMIYLEQVITTTTTSPPTPSTTPAPTVTANIMEYSNAYITATDYTMECIENCDTFNANDFTNYLQYQHRKTLKEDESFIYVSDVTGIDNDLNRRRLGLFDGAVNWFNDEVIKPTVTFYKEEVSEYVEPIVDTFEDAVDNVIDTFELMYGIFTGDIDSSKEFGISLDEKKSHKFSAEYTYKKRNVEATVAGTLDIEYGARFDVLLKGNLRAKYSIIPANFELFRVTVSGTTEFLAWFKAKTTAAAQLNILLFEKTKVFTLMVGPVPVIITLDIDINFEMGTEFSVEFMQQFGYKPIGVEFGVEYINGEWNAIKNVNFNFKLINDNGFKWGDNEGNNGKLQCPLDISLEAHMIPKISISLYKLVYFGLETDFGLINTFNVGDSCSDVKEICDIVDSTDSNDVLGLSTSLDFAGDINLVLEATVDIAEIFEINIDLGVDLTWKQEILIATFEHPNIYENCVNLPLVLDIMFKTYICSCNKDTNYHISNSPIIGLSNYQSLNGEYIYGGKDLNNNDYWKLPLTGDGCDNYFNILTYYIRKSSESSSWSGRYIISPSLSDDGVWIAVCKDNFIVTPDQCQTWETSIDSNMDGILDDIPFLVLNGLYPDIYQETKLTVTESWYVYCNGEFTNNANYGNVYLRNDLSEGLYQYYWAYSYPQQKWHCDYWAYSYPPNLKDNGVGACLIYGTEANRQFYF